MRSTDGRDGTSHQHLRRVAVIARYLLGRLARDYLRRWFRWTWVLAGLSVPLWFVAPHWVAGVVLGVALLGFGLRFVLIKIIARVSLARALRPAEDDLRDAVEAGKGNLRRELARVGLSPSPWRIPFYALRLRRASGRKLLGRRLREVDLDRVLPHGHAERAYAIVDRAAAGAPLE